MVEGLNDDHVYIAVTIRCSYCWGTTCGAFCHSYPSICGLEYTAICLTSPYAVRFFHQQLTPCPFIRAEVVEPLALRHSLRYGHELQRIETPSTIKAQIRIETNSLR